ncbi:MAG: hypothetical protein K8S14_08090, partial [Actinomycetia bacterium]|nr:hypothetical protein [Actinomycetes bacterium]
KTINYKFTEEIKADEKKEILNNIEKTDKIKLKGIIKGIFIEKGKNYNFILSYDLSENRLNLKFYSALKNELIFNADLQNAEATYNYFINTFFSVKIGIILKQFHYIITLFPENTRLYKTNDDYYVILDDNRNYYKYNNFTIVKKENRKYIIRYKYENNQLIAVEIIQDTKKYFIKINEVLS